MAVENGVLRLRSGTLEANQNPPALHFSFLLPSAAALSELTVANVTKVLYFPINEAIYHCACLLFGPGDCTVVCCRQDA